MMMIGQRLRDIVLCFLLFIYPHLKIGIETKDMITFVTYTNT
jgi:hypothetical protein